MCGDLDELNDDEGTVLQDGEAYVEHVPDRALRSRRRGGKTLGDFFDFFLP